MTAKVTTLHRYPTQWERDRDRRTGSSWGRWFMLAVGVVVVGVMV